MTTKEIRKYAREIAAIEWCVGCLVTMFIPMATTFPIKYLSKERGARVRNFWVRKWSSQNMWAVRNILGMEIHTTGLENVPKNAKVLWLSDHHAWADIPLLLEILQDWMPRFTAKGNLFKVPFLGWAMRMLGHIPLRRGDMGDERETQNWIVSIAVAFKGKSALLDRFVHSLSGISMDEFRERILGKQRAKAQVDDQRRLTAALADLMFEYLLYSFIIFLTGTRRTEEKYAQSREECEKKGLPQYKHVLRPRVGALVQLLAHLHHDLDGVAFVNIGYTHEDGTRNLRDDTKSFRTLVQGGLTRADIHVRWVPISQVPKPDKDYYNTIKIWSQEMWKEVDDALGRFIRTGSFEKLPPYELRSWWPRQNTNTFPQG